MILREWMNLVLKKLWCNGVSSVEHWSSASNEFSYLLTKNRSFCFVQLLTNSSFYYLIKYKGTLTLYKYCCGTQ
jgi:hypothetical protein